VGFSYELIPEQQLVSAASDPAADTSDAIERIRRVADDLNHPRTFHVLADAMAAFQDYPQTYDWVRGDGPPGEMSPKTKPLNS
jgi:hypothetical protein